MVPESSSVNPGHCKYMGRSASRASITRSVSCQTAADENNRGAMREINRCATQEAGHQPRGPAAEMPAWAQLSHVSPWWHSVDRAREADPRLTFFNMKSEELVLGTRKLHELFAGLSKLFPGEITCKLSSNSLGPPGHLPSTFPAELLPYHGADGERVGGRAVPVSLCACQRV